ncbi:NAD(P)/FAD-dependent oxidoreductase [Haloglomus litoreum]|uniref:NAD(P)/FAD-dependent oxidoreductase n=1 Tax=Haloglomus litoreum TaxID=3034026 RepID=UPI0023E7D7F4|nr:FAD-dependent oxidoreductase [Haloglomus sp. DT116]
MDQQVAVVGAGAVGTTAAHDLAARGCDVTLYEAETVGSGASGRAAGVCYDAFAEDIDAAVADRALARFRDLDADPTFDWSFTPCPYVWLAREGDDRRAAAIREQVPRMQAHDRRVDLLDGADLAAEFPALRADVDVAAVARDAGHADPGAYTEAMAERAVAAGVTLREGTPVELRAEVDRPHVVTPDGAAAHDTVVVAAGAHTGRLLGDAGLPVPVKPYRVQAAVTEPTPLAAAAPQLYDATGGYYCRPREGGLLVGDGTEPVERDPDDWAREADDWFVADCGDHLRAAFGDGPAGEPPAVERAWAGLCTATPDGDPLLGERAPGVVVAAGWQGHGFMRAPALGERIARGVCDGEWLTPFDPSRFEGDESFEIVEGMLVEES